MNEPLHAPPSYAFALGGAGATGWDWVIKSFEMARAHFPKSELILNDYSVLSLDNAPVATVPLAVTGDWNTMKTVSIPWAPIANTQDVYIRFNGGGANIDKFRFVAPTGTGKNLVADNDFELGTKGERPFCLGAPTG